MSSVADDIFSTLNHASQIGLNVAIGVCLWSVVRYFTKKDSNSQADLCTKWNTGQNVLIGHDSSGMSTLKAIVDDGDHMIDETTFNRVERRFKEIKTKFGADAQINLHLRTPGGDLMFAMLIAHIVTKWKGKVVAHIHAYSASGGTIIALACDELRMDDLCSLGPIDPQVPVRTGRFSLTEYLHTIGVDLDKASDDNFDIKQFMLTRDQFEKNTNDNDSDSSSHYSVQQHEKLIEMNVRTANSLVTLTAYKKFLERILAKHYNDETVQKIIRFFWFGRNHSMPLWRQECRDMGVNIVFVDDEGELQVEKDAENEDSEKEESKEDAEKEEPVKESKEDADKQESTKESTEDADKQEPTEESKEDTEKEESKEEPVKESKEDAEKEEPAEESKEESSKENNVHTDNE